MITINTSKADLENALVTINRKYKGNIKFRRLDPMGKRFRFTLTVESSKGKGGRIGHHGRRIAAACWHVHGDFFDELFKINPKAEIISMGKRITKQYGNWEDRNIGSMYSPMHYSKACECGKE